MYSQFEEKNKIFTNVVTKRPVTVHIQTINQLICGKVHIRPNDRLKDELNQPETFLAVTDALIYDMQGKLVQQCAFIAVNRSHIVWLLQDDEIIRDSEK